MCSPWSPGTWQQRSISEQQGFGLLHCSRREGLGHAAGTGQAWVSAAASLTRPGAPGQGGGQDKVLLLPPTSGGQGCSLGFRLVLKEDSGLGASQNESVSAQVVLGHSFVGVGISGDRVGPSSPRTSRRHRAGCLLP